MELEVRRAERSDLPAVKEMYAALVARMDREGWNVWSDTYPRDVVGEDIEAGQFYLLLAGDALAGAFALPDHDDGEGDVPWEDKTAPPGMCTGWAWRWSLAARGWESSLWKRSGSLPSPRAPNT